MAAPYNPPVKNEDFKLYVALEDLLVPGTFKVSPTIAAGDFQVSKNGGAFANLATLPSVVPSGTCMVEVSLSATEMNTDLVVIRAVDQTSPKEWADFVLCIPTTA